jgi:hypothetical protein
VAGVLAAFLPGLFFEVCVMIASPQIAQLMAVRAAVLYRYTPLLVAMLIAFVVGSAFMLWVRLFQHALRKLLVNLSELDLDIWGSLVGWLYQRAADSCAVRVAREGPSAPSRWFRFVEWLQFRNSEQDQEFEEARNAWVQVSTALLKRYGIDNRGSWRPWSSVLGSVRIDELRGYTLVTALHATGWGGLLAAYFAPELRTGPFEGLCAFLIFYGVLQAVSLALRSSRLLDSWLFGLQSTWDELKEAVDRSADTGKGSV